MANMGDRLVIKLRRGYARDWAEVNPVLELGEPGFERDTGRLKIGNGVSRWSDLVYFAAGGGLTGEHLDNHINSETPHPIYDDGPSLLLLYENAKV